MRLRWSARTDVGLARDHNEDNYGIGEGEPAERYGELLVVCDGMGGHAAGEVASRIGVDTIISEYYNDHSEERAAVLEHAFQEANARIYVSGKGSMGTTGVAALLYHDALHVANVGDSRAYLIRNGTVRQISRDHSFVNDQVAAGLITPEQARTSQHRNVITRAIGHQSDVTVDLFRYPLQVGDIVMLSSDGLHGLILDEEIGQIVRDRSPDDAVEYLVDLANQRGGTDNITVLLAYIDALDWEASSVTDETPTAEIPAIPDGATDGGEADQSSASEAASASSDKVTVDSAVTDRLPKVEAEQRQTSDMPPANSLLAVSPVPTDAKLVERRLTLLGGLLAAMLLAVLLFVILFNLPNTSATDSTSVTAPATFVTTPVASATAPSNTAPVLIGTAGPAPQATTGP